METLDETDIAGTFVGQDAGLLRNKQVFPSKSAINKLLGSLENLDIEDVEIGIAS